MPFGFPETTMGSLGWADWPLSLGHSLHCWPPPCHLIPEPLSSLPRLAKNHTFLCISLCPSSVSSSFCLHLGEGSPKGSFTSFAYPASCLGEHSKSSGSSHHFQLWEMLSRIFTFGWPSRTLNLNKSNIKVFYSILALYYDSNNFWHILFWEMAPFFQSPRRKVCVFSKTILIIPSQLVLSPVILPLCPPA